MRESQIANKLGKTGDTFSSSVYLESLMVELERAAISTRIKQARRRTGLPQRELADLMHVHWRTIQEWENPRAKTLPIDRLQELAGLLNSSAEWLLYGDKTPVFEPSEAEEIKQSISDLRKRVDQMIGLLEAHTRTSPQDGQASG